MGGKRKKVDFGRLVPKRERLYETMENGNVSVSQPRFFNGFMKSLAEKYLKRPDVKVRLDEKGTFVWNLCDGVRSNDEICGLFAERFGDSFTSKSGNSDVFDRFRDFMDYLEKCEMISYVNLDQLVRENNG